MFIYIFLFVLNIVGIIFPIKYQRKILPLWILVLFIFIGFRYEVGGDWINYMGMHQEIKLLTFDDALKYTDTGYGMIEYFSPEGIDGMIFVNVVCAAIFCLGLYLFCRTLKYPMFSVLISLPYFIFAFALGYSRQAVAMGFVLMAFPQLMQNKNVKFFLLTGLGCLFHFSAIIIVIFYLYKFIKKNFLQFVILFSIIAIIAFYFIFKSISNRLMFYTEGDVESKGGALRLFVNLIAAILFLIKRKEIKKITPYYDLMMSMIILTIPLFLISFIFSTIADRLGLYVIPLQMMVFPLIASFYKLQLRSVISIMIILFYFTLLMGWLLYSPGVAMYWLPYKNYLFL